MTRKKHKLSDEAEARIKLGSDMMAEVLQYGGIPEIVIAAKVTNRETSALDYFVCSPLERDKIYYVLTRVVGLMDGSIKRNN